MTNDTLLHTSDLPFEDCVLDIGMAVTRIYTYKNGTIDDGDPRRIVAVFIHPKMGADRNHAGMAKISEITIIIRVIGLGC